MIVASSPEIEFGQDVTLTATFTATQVGSSPMTGTVDFYDGSTYLGTAAMPPPGASAVIAAGRAVGESTSGSAALPTNALSPGTHTITAVYSGNAMYGPATTQTSATVVVDQATNGGPELTGLSRYGFHARSTVLVLYFNAPLDPTRAADVANYVITDGEGHRIAVKSAVYDPSHLTVTLRPVSHLNVHWVYDLAVVGTGSRGLTDTAGVALDGSGTGGSGSDFKTRVTWRALAVPGSAPAVTYLNGQPQASILKYHYYVDAVVRATKAMSHPALKADAGHHHARGATRTR